MSRSLLTLAGLTAGAAALRFATLGHQSFGHDEAVTVLRVLHPGLRATLREVSRSERTPYLYYVLAWLWTRVFGVGAVGIRSLSALFGTLTIPVAFAVALRDPSARALIMWALAAALALATHYFAVFLLAGEALWLLAAVRPRSRALLAIAFPVAVGGALRALLVDQASRQAAQVDQTSVARQIPTALVQFMFGERLSIRGLYGATPLLGFLTLVLLIMLSWLAWRWRWRRLSAIGTVGLSALLAPFALGISGDHYFNARNCIGCEMALLVLLAGVLSLRRSGTAGSAAIVVLLLCGLGMSVALSVAPALQRPDYRDADALLGSTQMGQRALVISPGGDVPTLLYRARHDPRLWPSSSEMVSEIDILAADDLPPGAPPPAGFRVLEQRDAGTVRVTRLVAGVPRLVSRATLTALSAHTGTPILMLETHG